MLRSGRRDAFSSLLSAGSVLPDTAVALTNALDPFHDTATTTVGWPTSSPCESVVQVYTSTRAISAPASAAGGNWDCHVFTLPEFSQQQYQVGLTGDNADSRVNSIATQATPTITLGPVNSVSGPTGVALLPQSVAWNPAALGLEWWNPDLTAAYPGQKKIQSVSFEVHNVTPKLTVGGSVAVYEQSSDITGYGCAIQNDTVMSIANDYINCSPLPPNEIDDVLLLPKSKQWNAEYGCYVVAKCDPDDNKFQKANMSARGFTVSDPTLAANSYGLFYVGAPFARYGVTTYGRPNATFPINWNVSGAYFTGLPNSTVLQITTKVIVESVPTSENQQLVVLSRPPAMYDENFFRLYKQVAIALPPGVMVSENAKGEWWKRILGAVEKFAPMVGGMLMPGVGGQIGQLVANAAGGITSVVQNNRAKKAEQRAAARSRQPSVNRAGASRGSLNEGSSYVTPRTRSTGAVTIAVEPSRSRSRSQSRSRSKTRSSSRGRSRSQAARASWPE